MAAASRDLSDVFTLESCNERGFLHRVGVSKAKLEHTHTKDNDTGFRVLLTRTESKPQIVKVYNYLIEVVTCPSLLQPHA